MGAMSGKASLVTGATSGIGKETALRLAALGGAVTIVGRDEARGADRWRISLASAIGRRS